MNVITSRLLISLDCLLDTRSGALLALDEQAAFRLLKSSYYAGRLWDQFPGVDMVAYKKLYAERGRNVLRYSMLTNTVAIAHDFVQRVMNKSLNAPVDMQAEIHLNIYPFVLTDEEQELLIRTLSAKLPLVPSIKSVSYSNEELNPLFVRSTYTAMIMYDFFDWIEIHSENELIKKYTIPDVTVYAPALLKHVDATTPVNLAEQFTHVMTVMQPFVNVIFLPVDVFCTMMAHKSPSPTVPEDSEAETDEEESVMPLDPSA